MMQVMMVVASAEPYANICTSLQTDNHTNTPSFNFYTSDALRSIEANIVTFMGHFDHSGKNSTVQFAPLTKNEK